jgi:hypothetical protein
MRLFGIGPRDVVALARHQRRVHDLRGPLLVTGMLAEQLAKELGAGGDPTLVETSGEPEAAGVFVRVVAGAATAEDERLFRAATRAAVPIVAVQTAEPERAVRLPYVLAEDVVQVMPGSGFPVDEIAERVAAAVGDAAAPLAASLPVLRDAVVRRRATDAAVATAALAALGAAKGPRLPVLALAQARMLSDVTVASGAEPGGDGREAAQQLALPLAAALGTGLVARELVRRAPFRSRVLDAAVAGAATLALGALFKRLPRI